MWACQRVLLVLSFINPLLLLVCLCVLWLYIIVLIVLSCLIFRPSACMSVCIYVHMYLCRDELSGHRKLNWLDWYLVWLVSSLDTHFIWLLLFFSCRGSNDGIAGMCTFLCKNCVYDRQKSTHKFDLLAIALFYSTSRLWQWRKVNPKPVITF